MNSSGIIPFVFSCLVIFLISTTTTTTISASVGGNETDYQALLKFKSMITNDPHEALRSWNDSLHFCDWNGVSCGKRHRRVTALVLDAHGLEGTLSPHVGNLSFLGDFSLTNNSFQGTIPHELGRLSRVRFLSLGYNKFNGLIPKNLSGCSNIEKLGLFDNNLVGSIPKEISFLSKLKWFVVQDNSLTRGIPPFLGNLTSMEMFSVRRNPLGGSIPNTLGHWKSLRGLFLGDCNLSGTIPHSIFNLSLLMNLSLSQNQLTGSLPSALGSMLPHIEFLQLWDNQLTGRLPSSISNCSKLRLLQVGTNNFSGKLTIDFSRLKDIYYLNLANTFYGSQNNIQLIDTLKNCSRLKWLILYNCNLQGVLPRSIGNLSNALNLLSLGENHLYGNLPSSIGNLVGLTSLILELNRFTGNIPSTIGQLQKLQEAYIGSNRFSGPIPDAIGNLSLLITLGLSYNRLEGHIPSSLKNCHRLSELYLGYNKISGQIPKQLFQLSSLTIYLDLSQNNLSGTLPTEVGKLNMLTFLDLSNNYLSGNIPSSIVGCTSLVLLSLSGNQFRGTVPSSLTSMRGVSTLDLSHNKLSGKIPHFSKRFSFDYVNLSFNDFEGEIPVIGVFANASAFSVQGNNGLCGGLAELGLPKCKETKKHRKKFPLFIIVILIASTLITILCLVYAWRKKIKGQPTQLSADGRFLTVSYNQLLKATHGFSEDNLIGEGGFGSVYKGILYDHVERFVAVKVLHLQNRGALKSFIAECEAWRSIRHRNLLKIITSCSSVDFQGNDFKALVYEFMPNGSLHDWLHSSANASRLNLIQRINILIDVASALDYLHNHCLPSIIHCDLKPSNILLDDEMVAHVGDFGLARFLGTNSNQNSTSGIRGTIGYAPPEYGVGSEMTSSGDVYSFGILLLEVMTRKRPTDDIFNEGLNLHKFTDMALPGHVTNVIDDDLLSFLQEDAIATRCTIANAKKIEECLVSTMKIGVSCSMESPPQRMNIGNSVHELQHILDTLQNM